MGKFDKYNKDLKTIQKSIKEAKNNNKEYKTDREVTDGTYTTKLESLEVGETKDGRPMLKAQFRIQEGEFKNWCLFHNRVLAGTKNDGSMINSATTFIDSLELTDEFIEFKDYNQFADTVDEYFDNYDGWLYEVEYEKDAFNNIQVANIFEED